MKTDWLFDTSNLGRCAVIANQSREKRAHSAGAKQKYERIHQIDKVSSLLKIVAIGLLVILVISQAALQFEGVREWITGVDRLEGRPLR
ncbi:hypothetical protein [Paenibacillus sp. GCM10027626]|uniref:hypothetical protein n=1 Tax=Paenibacillus sp. GCM10027626 TaxID=3273411 RepID=UPI00364519C6